MAKRLASIVFPAGASSLHPAHTAGFVENDRPMNSTPQRETVDCQMTVDGQSEVSEPRAVFMSDGSVPATLLG